jgi:predicted amidohydrolase
MEGETIRWMKRSAELLDCAIAGSLIIKEARKYFNRLIYIDQFGNLTWYYKRHLFRIANEEKKYTAGVSRLIVPLNGWRIYFQICYDLRFPVWSRNNEEYDLFVNLANWPANRNDVWETLLKARAIENLCYVAGVNRTGTDGNNIEHKGNSIIVDPRGSILTSIPESQECVVTSSLSMENLKIYRKNFPVWKDRDNFKVLI